MAAPLLPKPTDSEERALFRHAIVGDLVVAPLAHGALQDELKKRAQRYYRPPFNRATRRYHWKTFQRWLFAAREGLRALEPASRKRGFALGLDDEARNLLREMREEHPSAAADLLLDAAVLAGVIAKGAVSVATVRRFLAKEGLSRTSKTRHQRAKDRRRWVAERVCSVWHADVCHAWRIRPEGGVEKVYIHAIFDDHSRFVVALRACPGETENDLLELLVEALLRYPAPDKLYVDNGATYRGDLLALALDKLGIRLIHAESYDPEARGKMERFWRTLRQRLLDLDQNARSMHEMNAALLAWLDVDYHVGAHAGLLGGQPGARFREGLAKLPRPKTLEEIASVLVVTRTAKVRKDATFSVDGTLYEVRGRHLANKTVTVRQDPFTDRLLSVEHDGAAVPYGLCDVRANAERGRGAPEQPSLFPTPSRFQRVANLLAAAREVRDAG